MTLSLTDCNPGFVGSGGATGTGGSGLGVAGTGGSGAAMGGGGSIGSGAAGAVGGSVGGTGAGGITGIGTSGQGGASVSGAGGAAGDGGVKTGGHPPALDGGQSAPFLGTDLDQGQSAASSSAGCNCALADRAMPGSGGLMVGLFGLLLAGRRRRGSRSKSRPPRRSLWHGESSVVGATALFVWTASCQGDARAALRRVNTFRRARTELRKLGRVSRAR